MIEMLTSVHGAIGCASAFRATAKLSDSLVSIGEAQRRVELNMSCSASSSLRGPFMLSKVMMQAKQ